MSQQNIKIYQKGVNPNKGYMLITWNVLKNQLQTNLENNKNTSKNYRGIFITMNKLFSLKFSCFATTTKNIVLQTLVDTLQQQF